ncbi:MAG: hypothetical protein QM761_03645 [Pseudoxanthomonas sp.]
MKARLCIAAAALAAFALSGCVTYDTAGAAAPGGYYSGRPSTDYYYYGDYGYGYPAYGYGVYGSYGYYGYPSYYYGYPYGRGHYRPPPRPPHGNGHDHPPPPGNNNGNHRPPPWRAPAPGRESSDGRPTVRPVVLPQQVRPRQALPDANNAPNRPPQRFQPQQVQRPAPAARPMRPAGSESRRIERRPTVRDARKD